MYCQDCGVYMRHVSFICDKDDLLLYELWQCPKCKRIELEEYKENHASNQDKKQKP